MRKFQISYPLFKLVKYEFNDNIIFKPKQLCNSTSNPWFYCVQVNLGHIHLQCATATQAGFHFSGLDQQQLYVYTSSSTITVTLQMGIQHTLALVTVGSQMCRIG